MQRTLFNYGFRDIVHVMDDLTYTRRDLLGTEGLYPHEIMSLLDHAEEYVQKNRNPRFTSDCLNGRTQVNLFLESSTRTRASFELAGLRLGASVINMQVEGSSVAKGETLLDTARTLNAMHIDALVVRHPDSGAAHLLAEHVQCAVINGGDGTHEHPTQALLDALTIRRHKGHIAGLEVAICGDIMHSRVARSNIHLLSTLGAHVRVIAPLTLMPPGVDDLGVQPFTDMRAGLKDADIVMMLRVQSERLTGHCIPSAHEYFHFFGLNCDKLSAAKPDALVMHPGPMNRGVEIDSEIADNVEQSVIREQVEMGVAVRMAVLDTLIRNLESNGL